MSNVGKTLKEATNLAVGNHFTWGLKTYKITKIGCLGSKGYQITEYPAYTSKNVIIGKELNNATVIDDP